MPAKSKSQLKLVYAKRNQFESESKTPKKWKWVWGSEWGHLKEHIKSFENFITHLPFDNKYHTISREEYEEFLERVDDYMLEWNDKHVCHEFMKGSEPTFTGGSYHQYTYGHYVENDTIINLRIYIDFENFDLDRVNNQFIEKTEKVMSFSNLVNDCFHSIINRITKSYNIQYMESSHWDPFNHKGFGDTRWIRDSEVVDDHECLIRIIKFKLVSKK